MTQAKILSWLEGKPQIGQDTGGRGRGAGSYIPGGGCVGWGWGLNRVGRVRAFVDNCPYLDTRDEPLGWEEWHQDLK